eukprot:618197-Rhodomonas_salina.1
MDCVYSAQNSDFQAKYDALRPSSVGSLSETKRFRTSSGSSGNNDDSIMLRSGSSGSNTASPSAAANGKARRRQPESNNLAKLAKAKQVSDLVKRKKLSNLYGRLPGWSTRARKLDSSSSGGSSPSADNSLSNLGNGSTLVGSDVVVSTPLSQNWISVLSSTFKTKRDALQEDQEQSEQPRKKAGLTGPLVQLRKAIDSVKVMLTPGFCHVLKPRLARDSKSDVDATIKDTVATPPVPPTSEAQAILPVKEKEQSPAARPFSARPTTSVGGPRSSQSLLG